MNGDMGKMMDKKDMQDKHKQMHEGSANDSMHRDQSKNDQKSGHVRKQHKMK